MIRTFIYERNGMEWDDLFQVNTETEEVKIYSVARDLGFPFSEYYTTVSDMGYSCIKELLRHILQSKNEVQTDKQIAKEVTGLLRLAKFQSDNGNYICLILKDGRKYNDIVERLKSYGMDEAEALRKIDYYINHGIERHNVKVTYTNGTVLHTSINGTIEEIESYYKVGTTFNLGNVDDELSRVKQLEFIN